MFILLDAFLLTSLAIEAAESLVGVLLILHTCSVLSKGEVFVFIAGPLSRWKFRCLTNQAEDECCHQHLNHRDQGEGEGSGHGRKREKLCIIFVYPQYTDAPTQTH